MPKATSYFVNNSKNHQYQQFGDNRPKDNKCIRCLLNCGMVISCIILLIFSLSNLNYEETFIIHRYRLNKNQEPLFITSKKFLSFGLDTSLLRNMKTLPITDEKFINLVKHLSPAYIRIGGTSADCLFFNETSSTTQEKLFSPVEELNDQDITNFTITDMDFESLYNFTQQAELRMIFDLNVLIRNADGSWNEDNAKNIIRYAKSQKMDLDWQLGNEPNSFKHVFKVVITAKQLANDYQRLRLYLNQIGYNNSLLVGPEVNHIGDNVGESYMAEFLENDENSINYCTWHQYYLNGREARVEDFINPVTFDFLTSELKSVKNTIDSVGQNLSMWLSETSTAWGGGAPKISDRFVAGFLWLDKLGRSARSGVDTVVRQSILGGNYAMIGNDIEPNPDWWVSAVYKSFVSERVLNLISPEIGHLRLYAHCTPDHVLMSSDPAITIYGMNIDKIPARISIDGISSKSRRVFLYSLTSDDLQSRKIKMNRLELKLKPNGDLPLFKPVILDSTRDITLPPYSMIFIVIHDVEISACLEES